MHTGTVHARSGPGVRTCATSECLQHHHSCIDTCGRASRFLRNTCSGGLWCQLQLRGRPHVAHLRLTCPQPHLAHVWARSLTSFGHLGLAVAEVRHDVAQVWADLAQIKLAKLGQRQGQTWPDLANLAIVSGWHGASITATGMARRHMREGARTADGVKAVRARLRAFARRLPAVARAPHSEDGGSTVLAARRRQSATGGHEPHMGAAHRRLAGGTQTAHVSGT